jgi:hypothetical protein
MQDTVPLQRGSIRLTSNAWRKYYVRALLLLSNFVTIPTMCHTAYIV